MKSNNNNNNNNDNRTNFENFASLKLVLLCFPSCIFDHLNGQIADKRMQLGANPGQDELLVRVAPHPHQQRACHFVERQLPEVFVGHFKHAVQRATLAQALLQLGKHVRRTALQQNSTSIHCQRIHRTDEHCRVHVHPEREINNTKRTEDGQHATQGVAEIGRLFLKPTGTAGRDHVSQRRTRYGVNYVQLREKSQRRRQYQPKIRHQQRAVVVRFQQLLEALLDHEQGAQLDKHRDAEQADHVGTFIAVAGVDVVGGDGAFAIDDHTMTMVRVQSRNKQVEQQRHAMKDAHQRIDLKHWK
ncbi:hypothetical protein T4B_14291 [Trichinella pseudospiralis]|uniref:Uncharacterized protein n=1 Tax=Trichinella pseudospiralis TaxID=6337 RepID=A0A0V1IEM6_TRIPS|nr:hypothetical protein T4B_14291 [Trichinella pseudospiralis]